MENQSIKSNDFNEKLTTADEEATQRNKTPATEKSIKRDLREVYGTVMKKTSAIPKRKFAIIGMEKLEYMRFESKFDFETKTFAPM